MGIVKGGALRLFQTFLYLLAFCCSAIILGIFSYFLAVLADRHDLIARDWRAVEGLSGAAVLYTIFATVLTCCLGGITFFGFLGIVLDICFVGVMIAIAILTRNGAYSCSKAELNTPLAIGSPQSYLPNYDANGNHYATFSVTNGTACRMEKACFAVSIVAIFLFLLTAVMQVVLVRNHKKEKRFGPSPSNNYTSGYGDKKKRGLFARKNKNATRDAELGAAGAGGLAAGHHHDVRPSHDTAYTGTTVGGTNGLTTEKVEPNGTHAGYYTQPATTTANPYGYNTTTTTNTTTGTATNY